VTRITDRLVVQLADDVVVVMDETTGAEVTFPLTVAPGVARTLDYFTEVGRADQ